MAYGLKASNCDPLREILCEVSEAGRGHRPTLQHLVLAKYNEPLSLIPSQEQRAQGRPCN